MTDRFFVYILQCRDDTLYTGWTTSLENRLKTHNQGKGAKYTKARLPVQMIYAEECRSKQQAMQREYEIKKMKRAKKMELIQKQKNNRIRVAAAIIQKGPQVLICQRKQGGSCSELWEFPGGKLEAGESFQDCAVRECWEELNIQIKVLQFLHTITYQYPDKLVELQFFLAEIIQGREEALVHQQIKWIDRGALLDYPFCPADQEIIHQLMKF